MGQTSGRDGLAEKKKMVVVTIVQAQIDGARDR